MDQPREFDSPQCRRSFLATSASGLGGLALASLFRDEGLLAAATGNRADTSRPLAPQRPHFAPRAKSAIFIFLEGGPSQVDLFDPKPLLEKYALQPMPASFHPETLLTAQGSKPSDGMRMHFPR